MRSTLNSAIFLITAMAVTTMFTLGPKIESVINPVVRKFEVRKYWNDGGKYYIEGIMLKTRNECDLIDISIIAHGGESDENAKKVIVDLIIDTSFRPAGAQYWGPWEVIPPEEPIGPIFSIVMRHRCHSLWEQTQVVYNGLTSEVFPGMMIDREKTDG